jgi:hypothetical protein
MELRLIGDLQVDLRGGLEKCVAAVVRNIGYAAGNLFELLVADEFGIHKSVIFVHTIWFFGLDEFWFGLVLRWTSSHLAMNKIEARRMPQTLIVS